MASGYVSLSRPFFFLLLSTFCIALNSNIRVWPLPRKINSSSTPLQIHPYSFTFTATSESCDVLDSSFKRWWKRTFINLEPRLKKTFQYETSQFDVLSNLNVNVRQSCNGGMYPSLQSDESYLLVIKADGASTLVATTVWGALHGLETFSQLVYETESGTFLINETVVEDKPRFKHRGILLDTSRHFLSKEKILENLEIMSQNKFNVFHWHIVDDQSFPYQSFYFPELSNKGAFNPLTHIYTQSDVKEIVEYARLRGIRVVPEFDTPGHTLSWGKSHKELLTPCYQYSSENGKYGPVNPILNSTYAFMKKFIYEISMMFPDKYFHAGGDEVNFDCWKSNPNITKFMEKMKFGTSYYKLEQYYMEKLLDIVAYYHKHYMIWQEVIDNKATVQNDTVVHVWKSGYKNELAKVTSLGYQALLSSCWYLNYISYGSDWQRYYTCDPQDFSGSAQQKELVIGGEACMWGEYVDGTNLTPRLWPRASAVAERLWSDASVKNIASAETRLEFHRCRLLKRGVPAEPLGPGYCPKEM
ncbi:beta-hexosaminidase subunit alpha [Octopus sinensis]|uniref:Beta-hexosaminidase n=1 Tax=Octopus sinensis TaxID=2607531 RepID=A0A6P7TXI5_9MOLL|nr:beta-hexosaminidase subunit alpha [Octopus sinensis]